MEGVVHDGYLFKSPPEKRIVKPKWRRRWFVLRHSGLLPGQFILEYFTDNSCRKLKGKIDLDQCEQIDAGLPVDSKIEGYQHMFDIRTPKRTYYLLAETEAEMNKWVECICSVCGLKIHTEEDFLMPQDQSSSNPNSVITAPLTRKSSSNPYIHVSECRTGEPVLNGNISSLDIIVPLNINQSSCSDNSPDDGFADLPKDPPPPPPKADWQTLPNPISDEFYDHPRPQNQSTLNSSLLSSDIEADETYKVPSQLKSDPTASPNFDVFSTLPPRVNWKTYPDDAFLPNSSTVPRRKSSASSEVNVYDVVPSFHGSIKEMKPKKVQSLASHFENMAVKAPSESTQQRCQESSAEYINQASVAAQVNSVPPRPPKPSKMRDRHRYENFELPQQQSHKEEDMLNYDIPPPTKGSTKPPVAKSDEGEDNHPECAPKGLAMDDMYDFPKPRTEDNINVPVPPPSNTGTTSKRRHAYSNAPPGLFNSKDLIFTYEYRPSLLTSDGYTSGDNVRSIQSSSDAATPPSPSAIGAYANIPTSPTLAPTFQEEFPPIVNRELKPKRVGSNEDRGSFNCLTLQPPPVCRSRTKANKRSFRKPSPTSVCSSNGMPPVPNRFRHLPEMTVTSEDEAINSSGSRRNSSNDEQVRHFFPAPSKRDEIQYLDLDLDSEPSPSPKTPDRLQASTVYKQVDFIKTKVFNEMRQNVEESYRKSQ